MPELTSTAATCFVALLIISMVPTRAVVRVRSWGEEPGDADIIPPDCSNRLPGVQPRSKRPKLDAATPAPGALAPNATHALATLPMAPMMSPTEMLRIRGGSPPGDPGHSYDHRMHCHGFGDRLPRGSEWNKPCNPGNSQAYKALWASKWPMPFGPMPSYAHITSPVSYDVMKGWGGNTELTPGGNRLDSPAASSTPSSMPGLVSSPPTTRTSTIVAKVGATPGFGYPDTSSRHSSHSGMPQIFTPTSSMGSGSSSSDGTHHAPAHHPGRSPYCSSATTSFLQQNLPAQLAADVAPYLLAGYKTSSSTIIRPQRAPLRSGEVTFRMD